MKEFEKGKRYACKVIDLPSQPNEEEKEEDKNYAEAEKARRENSYLKKQFLLEVDAL